MLGNHWALGDTARACFEATWRSKLLFEQVSCYSAALENIAPLLFRTFHSAGVLRNHLALEIGARASFFVFSGTRKHNPSVVFSYILLEIAARACSAAMGRQKSWVGRALMPSSARNHCSSEASFYSTTLVFSFEISVSNCALLQAVPCATSQAL